MTIAAKVGRILKDALHVDVMKIDSLGLRDSLDIFATGVAYQRPTYQEEFQARIARITRSYFCDEVSVPL